MSSDTTCKPPENKILPGVFFWWRKVVLNSFSSNCIIYLEDALIGMFP